MEDTLQELRIDGSTTKTLEGEIVTPTSIGPPFCIFVGDNQFYKQDLRHSIQKTYKPQDPRVDSYVLGDRRYIHSSAPGSATEGIFSHPIQYYSLNHPDDTSVKIEHQSESRVSKGNTEDKLSQGLAEVCLKPYLRIDEEMLED